MFSLQAANIACDLNKVGSYVHGKAEYSLPAGVPWWGGQGGSAPLVLIILFDGGTQGVS